jgi:DNA phosphorothioation-associated putative methyltransferase
MASLGIAYVFKNAEAESQYLANLSIYRPQSFRESLIAEFSKDRNAQRYIAMAKALGRTPLASEFKGIAKLQLRFGNIQRIERIALGLLDENVIAAAREKRRQNLLTYFAMMRLQSLTPPPIRLLSKEVQADIKMLWTSYRSAIDAGTEFLFQLGKPELIKQHCMQARVGKILPEDFYIHRSTEDQLPALLSVLIFAGRQVVGETDYDIVKLALDGRKISFLKYRDFDEAAHPELLYSVRVHLPQTTYSIRDYSSSLNPPILHRKEMFVDPLHPRYNEYAQLTEQEQRMGLLSRPDIGTRNGWAEILRSHRLRIVGYSLIGEEANGQSETCSPDSATF